MTIHHATAKKALENGVEIVEFKEVVQGSLAYAATKSKTTVYASTAKDALAYALLDQTLRSEYPALTVLSSKDPKDEGIYMDPQVVHRSEPTGYFDFDEVPPTLAAVLAYCEDNDLDPEADDFEDEAEDEETAADVVPSKYKIIYAERGNRNHCGDWLAAFLNGKFEDEEGKLMTDAFTAFLAENGVTFEGKWASLPDSGQRGWQGRYRMNGRQKLERQIIANNGLTYMGKKVKVPADFMAHLNARHPS